VTERDASLPFFTVGHSTRSVTALVDLLTGAEVGQVVDVRTVPRSRTNPQFNKDVLSDALAAARIGYEHVAALGGLRGRKGDIPPAVNAFWTNQSFHNYADYAMSEEFRAGLGRLREPGRKLRCAIMCAEALWWRCHRRIIADYLVSEGEAVFHILGMDNVARAHLTPAAKHRPDGTLAYPARAHSGLE
jgi:uncharacterized protein (DUF488 family)